MNRLTKTSILINVVLLILLLVIALKENYPSRIYHKFKGSEKSLNDAKMDYWLNRDQLFEAFPKDSNAIVFIGTSLTQNFELAELFHHAHLKNRGIAGDVTQGVLRRLKPITDLDPKKIFIELGINDLFMHLPEDSLLNNYRAILDELHSKCPHAKIYIQSLFPISNTKVFAHTNSVSINQKISSVNQKLKTEAETKGFYFINVYTHFENHHTLNDTYTTDGVHLNGHGYMLWRDVLIPYVEE